MSGSPPTELVLPSSSKSDEPLARFSTERFGLYIIYSQQPMDALHAFLVGTAKNPKLVGTMRLDYAFKDGTAEESNRTFVAMDPSVFKELIAAGHGERHKDYDFRIAEYVLRESNAQPKDCSRALFMKLPLANLTHDQCRQQIETKLAPMYSMGYGDVNDIKPVYPTRTRQTKVAAYEDYAIIKFSGRMQDEDTYTVKILLDQLPWWTVPTDGSTPKPLLSRVSWCRKTLYAKLLNMSRARKTGKSLPVPAKK